MNKLLFLLLLTTSIISYLLLSAAHAQPAKLFIDSMPLPVTQGSKIIDINIDYKNNIWISTDGSNYIHRYNGVGNTNEFRFESQRLSFDQWGRTWSLHFDNSEIASGYFDTKSGQSNPVFFLNEKLKPLDMGDKPSMVVSEDHLYLLSQSGLLYSAKLTQQHNKKLIFKKEIQLTISPTNIPHTEMELLIDASGNVWFARDTQLFRYQPETHKLTDFSHVIKNNEKIQWGVFVAITKQQTTWVAIYVSGHLFRINANDQVTAFSLPYRIEDIVYDKFRDIVWIATINGLFYIEGESATIQHYAPEPWQDAGILSPTIRKLQVDPQGNLWIISSKGLHLIRGIHNNVQRIVPELIRKPGGIDARLQVVLGLTKENSTLLWWINRAQELVRYHKLTGKEQVFPIQFPRFPVFNEARSIAFSAPYILITTHSGHLLKFHTQTQQFTPIKPSENALLSVVFVDHYLNNNSMLYLNKFSSNQIQNSKEQSVLPLYGFSQWDSKTELIQNISCTFSSKEKHQHRKIDELVNYSQYKDTVWFNSIAGKYNILFKNRSKLSECKNFSLPFEQDKIHAVSQIDSETLWLVQGHYLRQINLTDKHLLYEQRLPLEIIDHAMVDQQGNFLVYGDNSLWRYDITNRVWLPLFVSTVSQDNKAGIHSFFDKEENIFYILSHQGILAIDTTKTMQLGKPQVIFTSVKIGVQKQILFEQPTGLQVPYNDALEVSYIATPLVPPKLLRFRYRLEKNTPWVTVNDHMQLLFTHLPHGHYDLEIQATFSHQSYGDSEFLQFYILPPWWHTKVAYVFYTLISALILVFIFYWVNIKKRLQKAELNEMAQRQKRLSALGLLAGGILHDFNNALFVISGATELIALKDVSKVFSKNIEAILSVVEDTRQMTGKLLSFSKHGGLVYSVTNIHDLLNDALKIVQPNSQQNIQIKKEFMASIPTVECDVAEIRSALINIIHNAYQAFDSDSGLIKVSTHNKYNSSGELDHEGNLLPKQSIVISIIDNGVGIAEEMLSQVFEPFVTTRARTGGTGLGLSVVYGAVKQHNGHINIQSKLNKGTQVTLTLAISTDTPTHSRLKDRLSTNFLNKCVLLCDDNKQIQLIIKEMLESLGIFVLLANNGKECQQIYQTHSEIIDLVILDDIMPIMGGRECFYELKMQNPFLAIIMLSGYRSDQPMDQLLKDGLLGIYKKPLLFEELIEILTEHLT